MVTGYAQPSGSTVHGPRCQHQGRAPDVWAHRLRVESGGAPIPPGADASNRGNGFAPVVLRAEQLPCGQQGPTAACPPHLLSRLHRPLQPPGGWVAPRMLIRGLGSLRSHEEEEGAHAQGCTHLPSTPAGPTAAQLSSRAEHAGFWARTPALARHGPGSARLHGIKARAAAGPQGPTIPHRRHLSHADRRGQQAGEATLQPRGPAG